MVHPYKRIMVVYVCKQHQLLLLHALTGVIAYERLRKRVLPGGQQTTQAIMVMRKALYINSRYNLYFQHNFIVMVIYVS